MRLYISIVIMLMMLPVVLSLGVIPSEQEISNNVSSSVIPLKIINNENSEFDAYLSVEGDLKNYVTLSEQVVKFDKATPDKIIYCTLNLPKGYSASGSKKTSIIITQLPKTINEISVGATLSVVSVIKMDFPYDGKFAQLRLFASNFEIGKESTFAIEIKNIGSDDIRNALVVIEIYDPMGQVIDTVTSEQFEIKSPESKIISMNWMPSANAGNYRASATLIYDGEIVMDERTFTIGEPTLTIISITSDNYKLNQMAVIDLLIDSNWNQQMNGITATVSVKDDTGKTINSAKSAPASIAQFGKQVIPVYLDIKGLNTGEYDMELLLEYNGKSAVSKEKITLGVDYLRSTVSGHVTAKNKKNSNPGGGSWLTIIILIVLAILVGVNIILWQKIKNK